jgi:hypothetical protein
MAGRYNNPIPPRFPAPINSLKIPALASNRDVLPARQAGNRFLGSEPEIKTYIILHSERGDIRVGDLFFQTPAKNTRLAFETLLTRWLPHTNPHQYKVKQQSFFSIMPFVGYDKS